MSNYKIITDSCCDFTDEQYAALDVRYVPLSVLFRGEDHKNFNNPAVLKDFYDGLRQGDTGSTSAVNPEGWTAVMEPVLKEGLDILCIAFSSGLSTTYQSAVIAAGELEEKYPGRKVRVIDSYCAALGQGLLVHHACRQRDAGLSLEELAAWVEETKLHICHWVTVDDLQHLKRGGRISAATAFLGGMLNIKPMIVMNDEGKLETVAKARGRKAAMEMMVQKFLETKGDFDNETVFIAHGDCPADAENLSRLVKAACPQVKNVVIGYVGGVIGAHTGPGVLVLFFLGDHR